MRSPSSSHSVAAAPGTEPLVRAAFTHGTLASIDQLPGDTGAQIRALVRPGSLARIEAASRLDWLPVEMDVELTEALAAVLGPERSAEFWRRTLLDVASTPLLRPIVEGGVRLFGHTPEDLLRWFPKLWDSIYRGCGTLKVEERRAGLARMVVEDLAPVLGGSRAYLDGLCASFEAIFVFIRVRGEVRLEALDAEAGRAEFGFYWSTRGRR
jgi:hypothetical protein